MIHSLNLSLQIENSHLKTQTVKRCDHQDECGCGMEYCNWCKRIQLNQCKKCDSESTLCNQCEKHLECDNKNCASYYRNRFNKCKCYNAHCIYCNIRKRKGDFPQNEIEHENIRQRHNERADQIAADQLNEYQAFVLNGAINLNDQQHNAQHNN